ncbi:MAG: tetratricopeptide repeat protein [Pseudomonadales bacterium]
MRSTKLQKRCAAVLSVLLLGACASQPEAPPEPVVAEVLKPAVVKTEKIYKPIPLQTLYSLLVADLAAQRNQFDIALRNYVNEALSTKDSGIARHATMLAELLQAENVALKTSNIWADTQPDDAQAQYSAAIHEARAQKLDSAMVKMTRSMELEGKTNFTALARLAANATRAKQKALLAEYKALAEDRTGDTDLLIGTAMLQQQLGKLTDALGSVQQTLAIEPDNVSAIASEARILQLLDQPDKAFKRLESQLEDKPDNKRLRLLYARLLTKTDLQKAQQQFEMLVQQHPKDEELRFTLALVYRENQQLGLARAELQKLIAGEKETAAAHYYLGLVEEESGNIDAALTQYDQVKPSKVFLQAMARSAELKANAGELEEVVENLQALGEQHSDYAIDLLLLAADTLTKSGSLDRSHKLLSDALVVNPEDPNLLYARSMLNEKRLDLVAMESDLRHMLELDPDNSTALNALGYTLTVHTKRYDEAHELIERALELKPNDPAIMDSMGWNQFRRGNLDEALTYLQRAHKLFPDPEVAAHLGEVLWAAGQQKEAKAVWRKALANEPENPIMKDIVERFGQP